MAGNLPTQLPIRTMKFGDSPWKTFSIFGTIFGITIIIYFGLVFGYKPFIKNSIARSEERIAELDRTAPKIEEKTEFIKFYSQLMNINKLLLEHASLASFFDVLEANTMDNVGFTDMTINILEKTVSINGFAGSYEILAGQLAVYEKIAGIERIALMSSGFVDRLIRFGININFAPDFFRFKPVIEQSAEQKPTEQPTRTQEPLIDNR